MARTESILSDSEISMVSALDALAISGATQSIQKTGETTLANVDQAVVVALIDTATPALDASLGNTFTLIATGNRTIAVPTNPTDGQNIFIIHKASGGARTLSLNTGAGGFKFGSNVTSITQTASGEYAVIGCKYSALLGYWMVLDFEPSIV